MRGLAIVGGQYDQLGPACLQYVNDTACELELRVAAATALGSLRPISPLAVQALDAVCGVDHPDQLRSAAILALAHLDAPIAARHIEAFQSEASILLRTSAAFTRHLTGDPRHAFDDLVSLIDALKPMKSSRVVWQIWDQWPDRG